MPMRVVTFKVDIELVDEIDRAAKRLGMSRSELIRKAIIEFLKQIDAEYRERWNPKYIRIKG